MKSLLLVVALAGCAEKIGPAPNDNPDAGALPDGGSDGAVQPVGNVTTTTNADGSSTTLINSTSTSEWIYIDIADFTESEESGPWDIRFQRFHISVNGGATGSGGVDAAPLDVAFDAVSVAPTSGWISDADTDGNGTIEYAFEQGDGWYDYNVETHVLTPKPLVWVVRSADKTIKLQLKKYYDTAGTAGWFTVTWRAL